MSEAVVGGLRVAYEVVGTGPAVLLLHGWGGCIASMAPIREALRVDHTVVSIDLPGFGESEMPREVWGTADYATCVGGLLREAGIGELSCVVGHSFGGKVAIHLALQTPVPIRSLMLVGTPGVRLPLSAKTKRRIAMTKLAKRAAKVLPGGIRRAIEARFEKLGSEDYRNAGAMRPILVRTVNEDLSDLLPGVRVPTLLVFGQRDTATPPETGRRMEAAIAGSGLVVLEQSGHFPYLDEAARFNAVARSFLGSVEGASA